MEEVRVTPARRSASAVVDALNHEWADLVERLEPCWRDLAVTGGLGEVVERGRLGDDTVLRFLVGAALAGDTLAGRTVLQALLGRLVRMAGRDRTATVDEYLGAFWCVLARYPLSRRPSRVAANLSLDTLKAVHRERQWSGRSTMAVWLAGDALDPTLERQLPVPGPGTETEPGAADLLAAGRRLRLLDDPTRQLLHHVYVDGLSGVQAAALNATTPGSLRVRWSRAVRRLAAHAAELAEAA